MMLHEAGQFGEALRQTLSAAGYKQAVLAALLHVNPSTVSRWVAGRTMPSKSQIQEIDKLLGSTLSLGTFQGKQRTRLFVSSPMLGLDAQEFQQNERAVREVVEKITASSDGVFWPGRSVHTLADVDEPTFATEENLRELYGADAFLYIQFHEIAHPSSALIELGIALGLGKSVTLIIGNTVRPPYMLNDGFEGVAGRLPFTRGVRTWRVNDSTDACALVDRIGLGLVGL